MKQSNQVTSFMVAAAAMTFLVSSGDAIAQAPNASDGFPDPWQMSEIREGSNRGCAISGMGSVTGSRLTLSATQRTATQISLVLRKPTWSIPNGSSVQARFIFSDGSLIDLTGRGNGQSASFVLDTSNLPAWLRGFTANLDMQVVFAGNEPPWRFGLRGTSRAVNAMGDCFISNQVIGVPPPFVGVNAEGQGSRAATQPFGGSLPPAATGTGAHVTPAVPTLPVAPIPTPPPIPSLPESGLPACRADWRMCRDNSDLMNTYLRSHNRAGNACKTVADDLARYGTPVWPSFWSGGHFGSFTVGRNYVETGIVTLYERDAQFQNGFGAMVRSRVRCDYDLRTNQVLDVVISPR